MASSRTLGPAIEILENHLFSLCDQKVAEVTALLDLLITLNKKFVADLENLSNTKRENAVNENLLQLTRNYQAEKIKHFENVFHSIDVPFFDLNNEEVVGLLHEFIKKQPKTKSLEQNRSRFYSIKNDSWYIKMIKVVKLLIYNISITPLVIANFFKRLFKKKPIKIPYWRYRLPYRKLLEYNLKIKTLDGLTDHLSIYSKGIAQVLKNALDKEQETNRILVNACLANDQTQIDTKTILFDFKSEKKQLTEVKKEFREHLEVFFEKCEDTYSEHKPIVGTIEYPAFLLNFRNRKARQQNILKDLTKQNIGWGNTTFALFEDWKIDQEIYQLTTEIRSDANVVKSIMHTNTIEFVSFLDKTKLEIDNFKQRILQRKLNSKTEISNAIREELDGFERTITSTSINPGIDTLVIQNFPGTINKFELKIKEFVSGISNIRWLTKLIEYDEPLKKSELDSFSPKELINFKFLPDLSEGCSGLKNSNIRRVEKFKQEIGNIPEIISFNLNSILDSIESGASDAKDAEKLVFEGIERSQNKLADIKVSTLAYEDEVYTELDHLISKFNESVIVLTDNESAFNLRISVTKAKAIKKTEEIRSIYWNKGKALFFRLQRHLKLQNEKFNEIILPWKRRIGILDSKTYIATELSDFLSESLQKINNLPIVYQQLYKIQPLKEMSLFTGRDKELKQLLHAYASWKEGKYAPTVIIGEKWSGHTTLINYFIKNHSDQKKIIYENRLINIKSREDFINTWKTILNNQKFETLEDVVQCLKSKHKNNIIIIENIQNYYLRTIRGFDCLNLLVKLISETYHEVFWLFSANVYAWEYLNNTIELSNYFGYHIKMEAFNDDKLRELIMKKNNISGYKIIFQPSVKNRQSKKFNNQNVTEQQLYLQNQFFNRLNEFAKGNISLALSYWLLSTNKITEESIEINNFESPDLSFITTLNSEKIFLIYLLIMHDGLTLDHLSEIYKKPMERLHLLVIMLLDDGILVERNDWFEVNPLIYRHSINMLKSKNLIY